MARTFTIAILLPLLLTSACETQVDLPAGQPELVVISSFTNNQTLQVIVSKSRSVYDNSEQEYILNAKVDLYREGVLLETLSLNRAHFPPSYASLNLIPEVSVTYGIRVEAPGFETVWAKSRIPAQIRLSRIDVSDIAVAQGGQTNQLLYQYNCTVTFQDPPKEFNYYHLNLFQQIYAVKGEVGDTALGAVRLARVEFDPRNDNNHRTANVNGGLLFDDGDFNGKVYSGVFPLSFTLNAREKLGKLLVEFRAVSEDYYRFHTSLSKQQNDLGGEPVTDPVPLYNNIENGAGIFAGYTFSVDSVAVIQ